MKTQLPPLPGVLDEIARIAGEEAALAIAEARGGTVVYIPPKPEADHWLSELVGIEAAREIADHLTCGVSGMRQEIPFADAGFIARQRAKVDAMIASGKYSESDIVRATGYTGRGVRKRKARIARRENDDQGKLFKD